MMAMQQLGLPGMSSMVPAMNPMLNVVPARRSPRATRHAPPGGASCASCSRAVGPEGFPGAELEDVHGSLVPWPA